MLWTSNCPGRGFAPVPARAPAVPWLLCPLPCGGARGGLQAAGVPATGRGGGPACSASHAGLCCGKKAADFSGSALAEPNAWQETLLILSQHSHGRAAQPQSQRDASPAGTA